MIRLELVNKDNFEVVLQVQLASEDQRRVASVEYSLAQAWLYKDSGMILPYAVVSGRKVVGFAMLSIEPKDNSYYLWRLLIDKDFQNRGCGKADPLCHKISINYVIGNHKMRYILEKIGFQSVGLEGQEMKMELIIK
ncbi:TPA: GNAT family N-acetyltransferase [Streptococcus suis]|nr:GNAT family N-acetyltransferase [Streptococcus suis]